MAHKAELGAVTAAHVRVRELCGDLLGEGVIAFRVACRVRGAELLLSLVVAAGDHREAAQDEAAARGRGLTLDLSDEDEGVIDGTAEEHVLGGHQEAQLALRSVVGEAAGREHGVRRGVPGTPARFPDPEEQEIGGELRIRAAGGGDAMAEG